MVFPSGVNTDLQQWRDDAIWGFAVRAFEHVQPHTQDQQDDLVLLRLMQMGSLNWVHPDFRSNQSMQGI